MALEAFEAGLARALSGTGLSVEVFGTPDAAIALHVVRVQARRGLADASRRDEGDGRLRRVSFVTAEVRIDLGRTGADAREEVMNDLERVWWRAEDSEVAGGQVFPRSARQGWAVEAVRPVEARSYEGDDAAAWAAHLELSVDARLWPAAVAAPAGIPFRRIVVQVAGDPVRIEPALLRVRATESLDLRVHLDVRRFLARAAADDGVSPEARVRFALVGRNGGPATGSLDPAELPIGDEPLAVSYTAGAAAGRERLEIRLLPTADAGEETLLGAVSLEVRA